MTLSLQLAETRLLLPAGLDAGGLERTFGTLLGPGVDFGDLYFQHTRRESWTVEDGIVKDGAHSIEQGVGVRAISGEKTGFAYSDEINAAALMEASRSARAIARDGSTITTHSLMQGTGRELYAPHDPIDSLPNEEKVEALRRIDKLVRAADPRVKPATEEDWPAEYLDAIIAMKVVDGVDAAMAHIATHGSQHTDSIVTEDKATAERFLNELDSAIVLHNASTQFADGGEFGFGAEIGIATGKLHARGPVGLEQLTTFKYQVRGTGQTRP